MKKINKLIFLSTTPILTLSFLSAKCVEKENKDNYQTKLKFNVINNENKDFDHFSIPKALNFGGLILESKTMNNILNSNFNTKYSMYHLKNGILNTDYLLANQSNDFTKEEWNVLLSRLMSNFSTDNVDDYDNNVTKKELEENWLKYSEIENYNIKFIRNNSTILFNSYNELQNKIKPFWDTNNVKYKKYNDLYEKILKKYNEKFFENNSLISIRNFQKAVLFNRKNNKAIYIEPLKINSVSYTYQRHLKNVIDVYFEFTYKVIDNYDKDKIYPFLDMPSFDITLDKSNPKFNPNVDTYVAIKSAYSEKKNKQIIDEIKKFLEIK